MARKGKEPSLGEQIDAMSPEEKAELARELEAAAPPEDEVVAKEHEAQPMVGPTMGALLGAYGDENPFVQDQGVYDRTSGPKVYRQYIEYDDAKNNQMRGVGEAVAAAQNPQVRQHASPEYKERLKNILEQQRQMMSSEEIVTHGEGRRIIMSGECISAPAQLKREDSLKRLHKLLGQENKHLVIEVCRWARSSGPAFVGQPLVWLSQQIGYECHRDEHFDRFPKHWEFDNEHEGDMGSLVPREMAALFGSETTINMHRIARINNVSMLTVLHYLTNKVCEDRKRIVQSLEALQTEYTDLPIDKNAISVQHMAIA